ncbi:MAG: D-alanyl-D-alanine carboxypeptidase [Oscillospiraceae bacterium]|nr:D-alanyl-D-alanine carboxypeptidase [Oscillospiraceae bacterium]
MLIAISLTVPHTAAADIYEGALDTADTAQIDAEAFAQQEPALTQEDITISAPSAILMEKTTGRVLYEKDADVQREPASVTKVMTILLIAEAIESNAISIDDMVTVSARAASMGGSQVFLEEGEQMSVHEMLKSIVVSSANDAAVAMAEHIAGTEEAFVKLMNERAGELGMNGTNFTNCSGLMDDPTHLTTARDIAIMSRELICHEMIKAYTTIWMDDIRDGQFGLSNTNKLIYYYDGATGLKTGFTDRAMYCLSATAQRDGVEYIAVIMHAQTSQERFEDAKALLNYAFANYALINNEPDNVLSPVPVRLGRQKAVQPVLTQMENILIGKNDAQSVEKTVQLEEQLTAPIEKGQTIGKLTVRAGENVVGEYELVASDDVPRITWLEVFLSLMRDIFAGGE